MLPNKNPFRENKPFENALINRNYLVQIVIEYTSYGELSKTGILFIFKDGLFYCI
jgi:hypothetical protein